MRLLTAAKGLTFTASALAMALSLGAPAYAQAGTAGDQPDPPGTLEGEVEIESGQNADCDLTPRPAGCDNPDSIVVTGSRIRRPNLESNIPVTSISADELLDQGDVNVGDQLNDLPSLRSTFSQANSTRFIGTAGINFLDLRGLGTSRTLVLVNGRRHITSSAGDFRVDVNTIPSDLIERVDIITGGSSAVYGSDAIAGVVNFILKRDFDGIRMRAQGGISQQGDRGIEFVALTAGQNFGEGRGNIAFSGEYVNAEPLFFVDRPRLTGAFGGRTQFNLAEDTSDDGPTGSDGVPDLRLFNNVRNATISNGGTIAAPISAAACRNPAITPANARLCVNPGTPQGQPRLFNFNQSGSLLENRGGLDFRPFGSGNFVGGTGSTLRDTGQLAPGLDRYALNVLAHFDLSDALQPFVEGKYVHIDALQQGQPSFFQGSFGGFFGGGRGIRCDSPFLTAENIRQLQAIGRCLGGPGSTETIPLSRFNVDFGGRGQIIDRDTYRIVGVIQGDFNDDWHYEISGNYGKFESHVMNENDLLLFDLQGNPAGFLLATDAVRLPSGQIVCRVNADANPNNDVPGCVPINPFGQGAASQAALDFVNTNTFLDEEAKQYNALAFVSGDLSQLFELPGGPLRFVVGGEYRRERAFQQADPLSASGGTFFNAFPVFDPPAFEVFEGFGELELPILKDLPFARELTITGAARYSDYNEGAGQANRTFAYNVNGTYAPTADIRFRANYSRAVRVPTPGDLFTPPTQTFAFVSDPCDVRFINSGGPNRARNCAALGVPVGFENVVARSQTIGLRAAGNPNLEEETGKSFTVGAVFTPRFLSGLSFTVDYYDIEVEDLIASLGAQTILNQCVDQPTINNQFCQLINPRLPSGDFADPNNVLTSAGVNFARQTARGIDFDFAYRHTFDSGNRLNVRAIATRVLERTNFVSPIDPEFGDRQLSELGDPKWSASLTTTYSFDKVDLRYSLQYIGPQTIGAYENYFSFQGRPPVNADFTQEVFYPDVMYHNFRIAYNVTERFQFYGGVDNFLDREPPFGLLGTGGGDPFDSIGRYFYAGARVDF